ncbi:hypothetical protein ATANTOWER_028999 [Ataeniobius toweri]|uniref:Uncharacterized protein n=1 Tax=Ataeniobius toweri TaxID=208326 RepID=A0ABU7CC33_9TELE|nr:hypothetical protein [Ataeniobius toweri]
MPARWIILGHFLTFFTQILEKLLKIHNISEIHQSGYRSDLSRGTSLLRIINIVKCNMDQKRLSVLDLLDLKPLKFSPYKLAGQTWTGCSLSTCPHPNVMDYTIMVKSSGCP